MAWGRLYLEEKYKSRKAAERLAAKQRFMYSFKAAFYLLRRDGKKLARFVSKWKHTPFFRMPRIWARQHWQLPPFLIP
jgi:hypothetical protein